MNRPVYVASYGAISAAGVSPLATWEACEAGSPTATNYDLQVRRASTDSLAISVPFCAADSRAVHDVIDNRFGREARRLTDNAKFAIFAVDSALRELPMFVPERTAVIWGSGSSTVKPIEQGYTSIMLDCRTRVSPMTVADSMTSAPAAAIANILGITGPTFATASACASSAHAIAIAASMIAAGIVDHAITGGSEILSDPGAVVSWNSTGVLSKSYAKPFMNGRDGINLGDGAASIILTANPEGAVARIGPITMSTGARDIMAPQTSAVLACITPLASHQRHSLGDDIVVNCHATGTLAGDDVEMDCLADLSRITNGRIICSTTKSITGHTMSASGALEAVIALMSLQRQLVPLAHIVEKGTWVAAQPSLLEARFRRIYSSSFGFGGMNCILSFEAL